MLLVLLSHQAGLVSLAVRIWPMLVPMVAKFKTLTKCTLCGGPAASLSLEPLGNLPSLTALVLEQSTFSCVEAAAVHLTRLRLNECTAVCSSNCMCVTSLVELQLIHSTLYRFHVTGIAACVSLERLELDFGSVQAASAAGHFTVNNEGVMIPVTLTALKNLTSLVFTCVGNQGSGGDLNWLSHLANLQSLEVLPATGGMTLTGGLTSLPLQI